METQKPIILVTVLLALIAGYCDLVTFVSVHEFFSSHVTGNFIVFAYDLVKQADNGAWVKLLSFPVFVIGVILGGTIDARSTNPVTILFIEGIILLLLGGMWLYLSLSGPVPGETIKYLVAMSVVFAMGLQNAFGRIYPDKTFGPTTMMTGLVIDAALNVGSAFNIREAYSLPKASIYRQLTTMASFLVGCIFGAISSQWIDLSSIIVPGILLTVYSGNILLSAKRKPYNSVLSNRSDNRLKNAFQKLLSI